MNLSNLHLLYGTTATISCAFNGYPPPSVSWKHDDELVQTTSHVKVTSCPTSSVLELTTLDYEDMGYYTCYITNSMGSVLTSMALSLYGKYHLREHVCACTRVHTHVHTHVHAHTHTHTHTQAYSGYVCVAAPFIKLNHLPF